MKNLFQLLTKKTFWLTSLILLLSSAVATSVNAQLIEHYTARLSQADHYNTEGVRLWTIGAIIRQDRANFHVYGIQDWQDEWDQLYDNTNNRASLERTLNDQIFSPVESEAILYGDPLIQVIVYPDYIDLKFIEY